MTTVYKFLAAGSRHPLAGAAWPAPGAWVAAGDEAGDGSRGVRLVPTRRSPPTGSTASCAASTADALAAAATPPWTDQIGLVGECGNEAEHALAANASSPPR